MHKNFLRTGLMILGVLCMNRSHAQLGNKGGGLNKMMQAQGQAQPDGNIPKQKEYELGGVTVSGSKYLDADLILAVTNLAVGMKIKLPNDEAISKAVRALWKQELFSDIKITVTKYIDDKVFLNIQIEERPRLSRFTFRNIKVSEAKELKTRLSLVTNKVVTEATKKEAVVRIKKYFVDKGFGRVKVAVAEKNDTAGVNKCVLTFTVDKGSKTHINEINIVGEEEASEARLKKTLKGTKEMSRLTLHPAKEESAYPVGERSFKKYANNWGFLSLSKTLDALDPYFRFKLFSGSKFNQGKFESDKQSMVAYLNTLGFRDAAIVSDTVYPVKNGNLNVDIRIKEGNKYYFGDVEWKGNTKYSSEVLSKVLGIKKGDIYNQALLETRIGRQLNPEGGEDVSSLYMDDGYLFFNIEPIEASIVHDTINYEMRISEGSQATIRDISIFGNDRTNDHVVRRELRTLPGNKFSRTDLIRSNREIAQLGFFDQEKIGIQPKPHPEDGTVDIEYTVVEKSSDQLQLSAGFGGGVNFYGNVGITFNNFSIRNIFKPKNWDPLPVGDGQKFAISYASNGQYYNSLSTSFTEPWLGGKKPNAFTANIVYSKYSSAAAGTNPGSAFLRMFGGGISMGKRLTWPDNFFVFNYGLYYNNYRLKNYALVDNFNNGFSNDLHFKFVLSRNNIDQPLYPRSGANVSFTFQITPPFSAFSGNDYSGETPANKYKWIEYHKYKFTADFYQKVAGNLVLRLASKYGFLGYYNKDIGFSPFERFQLGGDGLSGYSYFVGKDIVAQRGYEVYANSATIYNKYTAELRYPFSLAPTATIYGIMFVDAANAWNTFKDYNPFKLNRDVGVGIRLYLPMFGLLGLDYGIGLDRYDPNNGIKSVKDIAKFNFMLGFEPE
ncbi:outer membrane protein assembly factor [Flavipsychrobacter stenotrophus]|uniref:Outer membrane protein assembly factor n=1 Tax=Flavipsychrobacter stenotrophus TaxID=2077091 RepID=A0A2S7SRY4_9BACT|nr:POTRA domain-containing protein [Flavipsychrobacter stenotrophus]PQJ09670.1 outer membrane protein assembly factor [Flavipsychrobacter stenotrophus]